MNCIIAEGTAQASNAAKIIWYKFLRSALPLALVLLTGCGGGSSPPPAMLGPAPAPTPTPTPTPGPMGGAIQGTPLNLTKTVSTFAGSASANLDGTGTAARFWAPFATTSDGTNLYVADALNNTIRKIVLATGVVTTLAGSGAAGAADGTGTAAMFKSPQGIATDGANLYVADTGNSKIRKIVIATGAVTTLAGSPMNALGATDGTGTAAMFSSPVGVAIDSTGTNLYVADTWNNKIRKVVIATGAVSSFTGVANTASVAGAADGAAAAATFNLPAGIAVDSTNTNLYVADSGNNKIRKIVIATGVVSSFTGVANTAGVVGAMDGAATAATFNGPVGIAIDNTSTNLYVADALNNKIRQIAIATGMVGSLTGTAGVAGWGGATNGAAAAATFNIPRGVTFAGGNLYVADTDNNTIRQVALASAVVSTVAGSLPGADGTGSGARFGMPQGIASDGINLYVVDTLNNKIRKVVIATGAVTTLAGSPMNFPGAADGTGAAATFNTPVDITIDNAGANLYVVDRGNIKIRKIVIATGVVSSFTGVANTPSVLGAADGAAAAATFSAPEAITTDGANLYVVDSFNSKIRKIVIATGVVSSFTGVANTASVSGATDGAAAAATFWGPVGITTDGANLYVADSWNNKIRKIVIATGVVSSFTGVANMASVAGAADGAATAATFSTPNGITTDGTNLYVTDSWNNKIRQIVIASGVVSSVTGIANTAALWGATDGAGAAATFNLPAGITTDGHSLFVTDNLNNTIRRIQ